MSLAISAISSATSHPTETTDAMSDVTSRKRNADIALSTPASSTSESPETSESEASHSKRQRTESKSNDPSSAIKALFAIAQKRDLTPAEKNMLFVQEIGRMQIVAFKNMRWQEEFSTEAHAIKMCSTNVKQVVDASTTLPFFILNSASGSRTGDTVAHIDFRSVALPEALKAEINKEDIVKEKAGVSEITTLQQWAHGTAYRYATVQVQEPMPAIQCASYSAVTLVPLMKNGSQTVGLWDPFFKGTAGVKLLLTYGSDVTSREAIGGGSAYIAAANRFTILQDSPIPSKQHHWQVALLTDTEKTSFDASLEKIKRTAVNFAIVPCSTPGRITYISTAKQKVEPEQALHMKIHAIPIDVSEITTEAQLEAYMIALERLFIGLADTSTPRKEESKEEYKEQSSSSAASASLALPEQQSLATHVSDAADVSPTEQSSSSEASPQAVVSETSLAQKLSDEAAKHISYWKGVFGGTPSS